MVAHRGNLVPAVFLSYSLLCMDQEEESLPHTRPYNLFCPSTWTPLTTTLWNPEPSSLSSLCCWRQTLWLLQRVTNMALVEEEGPVWEVSGDFCFLSSHAPCPPSNFTSALNSISHLLVWMINDFLVTYLNIQQIISELSTYLFSTLR